MDEKGKQYGSLVSIYDATEERHKLQDLQAFTGSAAHDLNSPLNKILGVADLIDSGAVSDEDTKMLMSAISETAKSMKQLLHDLLAFSKLAAGQMEKNEVDINTMVREICKAQTPANFRG